MTPIRTRKKNCKHLRGIKNRWWLLYDWWGPVVVSRPWAFFIFLFCLVYALFLLYHNFSLPLGGASFANGFFFFHNKKLALLAGLFCMLHNCTTRWYGKYGSRINCLTLKCDQASLKKASQWNNYIVYRNRLTIAIIIGGECSAAFFMYGPAQFRDEYFIHDLLLALSNRSTLCDSWHVSFCSLHLLVCYLVDQLLLQ